MKNSAEIFWIKKNNLQRRTYHERLKFDPSMQMRIKRKPFGKKSPQSTEAENLCEKHSALLELSGEGLTAAAHGVEAGAGGGTPTEPFHGNLISFFAIGQHHSFLCE